MCVLTVASAHYQPGGDLQLRGRFASGRQVAVFQNGIGVTADEQGMRIFIATGLKTTWAKAWPAFRNYS